MAGIGPGDIAYQNKPPEKIDVIIAKSLCCSDVTLNKDEATLLFPGLLNATASPAIETKMSLFLISRRSGLHIYHVLIKHGDKIATNVWPKLASRFQLIFNLRTSKSGKKLPIRGISW